MREIKFRGRVPDKEWLYGDLRHIGNNLIYIVDKFGHGSSVNPNTVGQFTGLHDANGREIYEGDVIKLDNEVYIVSWAKYSACWFVDLKNFGPSLFTQYHAGKSIVIGNVHDNPELLRLTKNDFSKTALFEK